MEHSLGLKIDLQNQFYCTLHRPTLSVRVNGILRLFPALAGFPPFDPPLGPDSCE